MAQKTLLEEQKQGLFDAPPAPASPFGSFAPQTPQGMGPVGDLSVPPLPTVSDAQKTLGSQSFSQPTNIPAPANPNSALAQKVMAISGSAASGFGAGSQIEATPDAGDAALQVAGAGLSGAASGAAMGSVIPGIGTVAGGVVGGVVGLVTGGINAFLGTKRARAQNRQRERENAEIRRRLDEEKALEQMRHNQERGDEMEKLRYNRHINRVKSQWDSFQSVLNRVNDVMKNNADFREAFIRGSR